ncbi:hypothetical protein [Pseudomonas graminis]
MKHVFLALMIASLAGCSLFTPPVPEVDQRMLHPVPGHQQTRVFITRNTQILLPRTPCEMLVNIDNTNVAVLKAGETVAAWLDNGPHKLTVMSGCAHKTFTPRKSLSLIADGKEQRYESDYNRFTGLFRLWQVK